MILAAAIKYHIDATNKDTILCGHRHYDILNQLCALGFEPRKGYKEICQGYIDHDGNFLSRREAYVHARECGQLCSKVICDKESSDDGDILLLSEELW